MVVCNDVIGIENSTDFIRVYDGKRPYYGGNQFWFKDEVLRKVGCSIVAAANITAYMAMHLKMNNLFNYEDMTKENFLNHMNSIAEFIEPDRNIGVISSIYFQNSVNDFFKSRGVKSKSNLITTEDDFNDIKEFIKKALSQNKPIALLMLKNKRLQQYDWHWMTITRIFENVDKTYLDISTWGERHVITLEDVYIYSHYGTLTYFDATVL